jgi:hypothetical protein
MSGIDDGERALATIRGSLEKGRANARSVAALTDNPGCTRRRVLDAANVKSYELAERLGFPVTRGQSPFAITTGKRFEDRLKERSDYKLLVEVLQPFVQLPAEGLSIVDLDRDVKGRGTTRLDERARRTDEVLVKVARGDAGAPHIVDHPVLVFDLAGTNVYLEPDALAFRVGNKLELVEIKSYAIIDGQADPSKLAATAGQSAVYVLALRATLARLGFDPALLASSVILVAPRNFGRTPVAHRVPLQKKLAALQRVLRSVPKTSVVVKDLPKGFTLDVDPKASMTEEKRRDALEAAVRTLPMLYVPDCLAGCDMARFCREQAIVDDDPARLGRSARDNLAGVHTLSDALRLATRGPRADEPHLAAVADALQGAHRALVRARTTAGMTAPKRGAR